MTPSVISFEAAFEAALAFYLAALLPAAVVTVLKGRHLIFAAGFLTLGLIWFPAAFILAPPESRWARTFYDDRQLARAENPERYPRSWWPIRGYMATVLVCVLALGLVAARPAPILGVGGKSLEYSTGGSSFSDQACERISDGSWTCPVWDAGGSGAVPYRVDVDSVGCWTANRIGNPSPEGGTPDHLSGCITMFDYLRIFDRVFG